MSVSRLIVIHHTNWRPAKARESSPSPCPLSLHTVAQLWAVHLGCTPPMRKAVIIRTSDFSLSLVHGSIALSPFYFMAELVGFRLAPNLSPLIPTHSLGLLNPKAAHSLHFCFCGIVFYFIDSNEAVICVIWTQTLCLSRFMCSAFSENPCPVKSLTPLAVFLLNNCQLSLGWQSLGLFFSP